VGELWEPPSSLMYSSYRRGMCPSYLASSCRAVPIEASDGMLYKDRKRKKSASLDWQDEFVAWKKLKVEKQKLMYTRAATRE
jgi:hypothetical protein